MITLLGIPVQKGIADERGQRRRFGLVEADRKVTVTQITMHYNSGMQKSMYEHTTCQTSKKGTVHPFF